MDDDEIEASGEPPAPQGLQISIEPSQRAGVWANWAHVTHSEHEFTLDFVRMDPLQPSHGIVVARVVVPPSFVTQLIDALTNNWQKYGEKAMPK